jgi:exonuclease SbcC
MILKYLKLHNIRSYVNEKIDFPDGSVLLCGDIGSGKSTILLAIEFALFGLKRGEFTGSSLLRHGEKEGSVELKFLIRKESYEKEVVIHRALKRTNTSVKQDAGHIIINGQRSEGTAVELKSHILKILGYPDVLVSKSKDLIYRYSVYTPQEEMKQIIFSDKEERLDTLRRVFNIDKYKRIRDNLQIVTRQIRETVKNYEGRIYALPEKTKQYKEIIKEANDLTRLLKEMIPSIKENAEQRQEVQERINAAKKLHLKVHDMKHSVEYKTKELKTVQDQQKQVATEMEKIQAQMTKTQEKLKEFSVQDVSQEYLDNEEKKLETLQNSLNEQKNTNNLLQENIKNTKEQIKVLEQETTSKKRIEKDVILKKQELKNAEVVIMQKEELEKNIEKVQEILKKVQNQMTEVGVRYATAEKVIADIKELDDCPTCHQKVTPQYKKEITKTEKAKLQKLENQKSEQRENLKNYEERLKKSRENIQNIVEKEKEVERLKAELESYERNLKEFDQKKSQLEQLENKVIYYQEKMIPKETLQQLEVHISEQKKNVKHISEAYTKVKEKQLLLESVKEKQEQLQALQDKTVLLQSQFETLQHEITELEKQLKEHVDSEKQLQKLEDDMTALTEKDKELNMEKTSLFSQREALVRTKDSLEKEIKEMREIKEKIAYQQEMKTWLTEYFSQITVVIERNIMMRVFNEFNELFKEWFNMMIEDEVITVRLDEEFTPIVEQNGYEVSVEDLSGGEKTSLALAYRLALNKVINDCIDSINTDNLIILDEPTDGFSSEQLDRLREVLDQLTLEQIIIVSHETKIESFVDSIIRINKSEHISSIV